MCVRLCVHVLCIWWHHPSGGVGVVSTGCVVLQCSGKGQAIRLLTVPLSLSSRSNSFTFGHGSVSVAVSTSRCCRFWSLWFLSMTCASVSTMWLYHQFLCLWCLLYNVLEEFLIKYNRPVGIEIFSVTVVYVLLQSASLAMDLHNLRSLSVVTFSNILVILFS